MTPSRFAALGGARARAGCRLRSGTRIARFLRTRRPDEIATARPSSPPRFPASDARVWASGLPRTAPAKPRRPPPLTLLHAPRRSRLRGGQRLRRAAPRDEAWRAWPRRRPMRAAFLARFVGGEMRTGVSEGLLLEAIAAAWGVDVATTRRGGALPRRPHAVAVLAATGGAAAVAGRSRGPSCRCLPMLAGDRRRLSLRAGRARRPHRARVQVRRRAHPAAPAGESRAVWTRRCPTSRAAPTWSRSRGRDLFRRAIHPHGEVVALDAPGGRLPFQELMRRFRRVHGVEALVREMRWPCTSSTASCRRTLADRRALRAALEALTAVTGGRYLAERRIVTGAARPARSATPAPPPRGRDGRRTSASTTSPAPRQALVHVKAAETVDWRDRAPSTAARPPRAGSPLYLARCRDGETFAEVAKVGASGAPVELLFVDLGRTSHPVGTATVIASESQPRRPPSRRSDGDDHASPRSRADLKRSRLPRRRARRCWRGPSPSALVGRRQRASRNVPAPPPPR